MSQLRVAHVQAMDELHTHSHAMISHDSLAPAPSVHTNTFLTGK